MSEECGIQIGWLNKNINTDCIDVIPPMKNVDDAIASLYKSAAYGILKRSFELSDAPDFAITINDDTIRSLQTIIYKDKPSATITMTYGNPFTFELKFL